MSQGNLLFIEGKQVKLCTNMDTANALVSGFK